MEQHEFVFNGSDGKAIHVYCWAEVENPKAAVQLVHGMAEHAARYGRFAEFLNKNGFIVYAGDHRGHGKTAGSVDETGFIGEDGFNRIVEDNYILTGIIKKKHCNLPVFLLGHSFGSFIAQDYITQYGDGLAGVILSGSTMKNGPDVKAGFLIAAAMTLLGERKKNPLIDYLSFGSYNRKINKPWCKFAWLSRDEAEVGKYNNDPFCGEIFTTNFYYWFLKGLSGLYKKDKIAKIPVKLPVYIISGDNDPLGNYGKSVVKLYEMYKKLGIYDIQLKLYPGGRHEILNETNRDEVFSDILKWLANHNVITS
jgi:alpha-beta hydrolase superfamily lysophospholipase